MLDDLETRVLNRYVIWKLASQIDPAGCGAQIGPGDGCGAQVIRKRDPINDPAGCGAQVIRKRNIE